MLRVGVSARRRGPDPYPRHSYAQYTLVLWQQVTTERLRELGIEGKSKVRPAYASNLKVADDFLPTDVDYSKIHARRDKAVEAAIEFVRAAKEAGIDLQDVAAKPELLSQSTADVPSRPRSGD